MSVVWDPITGVNLVLCLIIVAVGIYGFEKSRDRLTLFVTIAFGLFGVSHLATLLGLKDILTTPLIIIRTFAYLSVIYALISIYVLYRGLKYKK